MHRSRRESLAIALAVAAPAAWAVPAAAAPPQPPTPAARVLELGRVAAAAYADCRREARYAVDTHAALAPGQPVPPVAVGRVRDCLAHARYLVDGALPAARDATASYPRAVGYLRDWEESYARALSRLRSDAENPRVLDVPDQGAELSPMLVKAAGEIHW